MGAKGETILHTEEAGSTAVEKPTRRTLLLGNDPRSLDDRGRLSLPTKYRWAFDDGAVVVPWPGPCIAVLPVNYFLKIERKMRNKQRDLRGDSLARDALTELASHSFLDAQGRLFLDADTRGDVGISHELVLIGRVHYLQLWAPGVRDAERDARMQALHAHIAAEAL